MKARKIRKMYRETVQKFADEDLKKLFLKMKSQKVSIRILMITCAILTACHIVNIILVVL